MFGVIRAFDISHASLSFTIVRNKNCLRNSIINKYPYGYVDMKEVPSSFACK